MIINLSSIFLTKQKIKGVLIPLLFISFYSFSQERNIKIELINKIDLVVGKENKAYDLNFNFINNTADSILLRNNGKFIEYDVWFYNQTGEQITQIPNANGMYYYITDSKDNFTNEVFSDYQECDFPYLHKAYILHDSDKRRWKILRNKNIKEIFVRRQNCKKKTFILLPNQGQKATFYLNINNKERLLKEGDYYIKSFFIDNRENNNEQNNFKGILIFPKINIKVKY